MKILQEIIQHKRKEVAERQSLYPEKLLERSIYFETEPVSLKKYLLRTDKSGIIAEFKRKSPSKGMINEYAPVERVSIGYMQAGASALSILTDQKYFGGSNEDLTTARKFNYCSILRKDFIIDPYQVIESKSIGADAILLIAAVLEKEEVKQLAAKARELGMEVLMEVHNEKELDKLNDQIDIVGVNNRNLENMSVNIGTSEDLAAKIPEEFLKISESGMSNAETIIKLKDIGYKGFLIGTSFMEQSRPELACRKLIDTMKEAENKK